MILGFLILGMIGFRMATNKNEGMNIPNVASIAPKKPFTCTDKCGGGQNWSRSELPDRDGIDQNLSVGTSLVGRFG